MQFENLSLEIEDRVATLTLNRPKALNALNRATLLELDQALEHLATNRPADVLILTGAGPKSFVAGADIVEMKDMTPAEATAFAQLGQAVFWKLRSLTLPVIAAVNGFALGGGCELAIACDLILASESARFGQPEVNLGVIPGFGGTQRLSRLVGPAWARYLIFSGEVISANEARDIGLVLKVFPAGELLAEAQKLARTIASRGPVAVGLAKDAIDRGLDSSLTVGLALEAELFGRCFATADQTEGMEAFVARRPAKFTGR